jgi:hypothetical protein
MSGPKRLKDSGGVSQRLLDSASIDVPSSVSRARAHMLAATASSFAQTHGGTPRVAPVNVAKTLATWVFVGAAASIALALGASQLLDATSSSAPKSGALPALTDLPTVAKPSRPSEIAAEPNVAAPSPRPQAVGAIEPWVPSPQPSAASAAEVRDLEAIRAAIIRGDAAAALAALNAYDAGYPSGRLKPESTVLRIQALSLSGKTLQAGTAASEFLAKYPGHPLAKRMTEFGR